MKKKKTTRKLNFRQQKLLDKIYEYLGSGKPIESKAELLRLVGYKESVALNPRNVFDNPNIANGVATVIKQLEEKRQLFIDAITVDKANKGSALSSSMSIDILTKNIELLSGRPTERSEEIQTDEQTLERILERSADGSTRETVRASRRSKR